MRQPKPQVEVGDGPELLVETQLRAAALPREKRRRKWRHDCPLHQAEKVEFRRRPGMQKPPLRVDHVAGAVDDSRPGVRGETTEDHVECILAKKVVRIDRPDDSAVASLKGTVEALADPAVRLRHDRDCRKVFSRPEVLERAVVGRAVLHDDLEVPVAQCAHRLDRVLDVRHAVAHAQDDGDEFGHQ